MSIPTSRRRLTPLGTTLVALLALAACGTTATDDTDTAGEATEAAGDVTAAPADDAAGDDQVRVAFITKPLDNVYFGSMVTGGEAAAEALGVDLMVAAAQNVSDDTGQASKLSSLVSQGFDCYILNPTSPTNLITPLTSAGDATIINIDLEMDFEGAAAQGVDVTTFIGTVNEDAGAAGGEAMLGLVPEGSQVAIIGTLAQDAGNIARQAGFNSVVEGKLEVVQTVSADADRVKAKNAAAAIMRANPDVKGFFTPAGTQAMGIQEAIEQEGRTGEVVVVGIDGTEEELQSIADGKLASTVEQFPYLMGYQAVQACVAAHEGSTLPERVDTPVMIVTKDNAAAALASSPAPPEDFEVPNPFED
ncbi:substrate-binding domain-containing protein [Cellulomonas sp. KRMCY2]|uniref:substrate-binding domain-containing protein n=1 Tax=Cellulomonas sp. KRMCY2 TaxID=1304865 RepID=UPI00045E87BC|nr:substrate-binding domain-containing protein [Cellulomonas sp. KRMCY2]